jgi:hypothetical protein
MFHEGLSALAPVAQENSDYKRSFADGRSNQRYRASSSVDAQWGVSAF